MIHRNNPRSFHSLEEENVAADSQSQQHARPWLSRSQRRRSRQTTPEWQGRSQARALKVYRFRSRAPPVCCNAESSLGLSRKPVPIEDGKLVEMLARSASSWEQQESAQCWVRDCTRLACSAAGHPSRRHLLQHSLLGEEDHLTSLLREEQISRDGSDDDSTVTTSSQADVTSDDAPRSFAEEYSLAPLNTRKKYSAWSFDHQVENYFKSL